ncbi:hypothetical protein CALCODRAFT_301133 [Calocera cornea HHB12733]|uniref:Zn(2)-C6 fungal-type domain-containing protein n=1 Tax=Calocera cornea HHB12733 TaxID=1353952 RepID=A0A165FHU2_9BASI|nr:hypothetical protein CALCODRAFT_301133 [Calocera cornea HHB12733]
MSDSSPAQGQAGASSSSRVHPAKRQKACDACHRRKIRCNGEEGGEPCPYCVKNGYECTYHHQPNKWPPSKAYVDGLEQRVAALERRVDYLKRELAKARSTPGRATPFDSSDEESGDEWTPRREEDEDEDTQAALRALTDGYEDLWLGNPTGMRVSQEPRMFHGQSSHFQVVNQHLAEMGSKSLDKGRFFQLRVRPEFRMIDPDIFDHADMAFQPPDWPEPDLALALINAFFDRWNNVLPLLHRPTFMRQYQDPAMRLDNTWVAVAFGVFAIAAKYIDDPRALGPGDGKGHYFDAGIKYWNEMKRIGSPLYAPPSLFRLQALILFTYFLSGQPLFPSAGWALVGLGLRYVQDAGMHLKKEWLKRAKAHPFEYEMRKRVFWVLYMMERTMALEMDRSFCMPEEDYEVDLLLELDDAALDLLQQGQTNPTGFSHGVAAYNTRIRLLRFASEKRDSLYALRHIPSGHPSLHEREASYLHAVRQRLQNVKNNIHKDLIYKPEQPNNERFLYSAMVHIQYHWVELILYRPFFSKAKRTSHSDFPILAISTTASHDIVNCLDKLRTKNLIRGRIHEASLAGFVAGSVILMNMWEEKNLNGMKEVDMCLAALQALEDRWQFPGLLYDALKNFSLVMQKTIIGHCPHSEWKPPNPRRLPCDGKIKDGCPDGKFCNDALPSNLSTSVVTPVVTPMNGVVSNAPTMDTAVDFGLASNAAAFPDIFLGTEQDPFAQPFSAGQTGSFFSTATSIPMAPPQANQPMFGEDGWLNDLNFGGHGFMDPQFNEWLNSMLLATQEAFPMDGATDTSSAADEHSSWLTSMRLDQPPS